MNAYVTYNTEYKLLICRQHKCGIARDYIQRHFRRYHQTVPLAMRDAIVDYSKTIDLAPPQNIAVVEEMVHAIEGLTVTDGYQCTYYDCSEVRGTEGSMKEHCKKDHGWLTVTGIMWKQQAVQTIFEGSRRKYISIKLWLTVGSFQLLRRIPLQHCRSTI
jgi:hypothetical protein